MLFNSYAFLFLFLPFVLLASFRFRGQALLRWLTISSFAFYAFAGHAWFLWPMLVTTCLDFTLAPRMAGQGRPGPRRAFLVFSLACNLGLLAYFKYAGFFLDTVGIHAGPWMRGILKVALPAGISFYTFQTVSYMIDVYRGDAPPERNFWKFAGFVSFFPHLVAGPLTRHHQLIPGLSAIAADGVRPRWESGFFFLSVGLAKKILLGDRMALFTDRLLADPGRMGAMTAWLALLGFTLQIYFDFSGYTDMALGIARFFGITLPQNFNAPYQAGDIREFWRRWHMTLSSWLRDYLYIPLGGNRKGPLRQDLNLMATMFLGGLWHGASWNFALWGSYHGILLAAHRRLGSFQESWPRWSRTALTLLMVALGWVFFRAPTLPAAGSWFASLAGLNGLRGALWDIQAQDHRLLAWQAALGLALCLGLPETQDLEAMPWMRRKLPWICLGATTALCIALIPKTGRFIYFQF